MWFGSRNVHDSIGDLYKDPICNDRKSEERQLVNSQNSLEISFNKLHNFQKEL